MSRGDYRTARSATRFDVIWYQRREIFSRKKEGPQLGIRGPKGRVPVIRPRRDRIMGSSILASLSEAGGNDPCHPANGPLPPHSQRDADRVGTRPTPSPNAFRCPLHSLFSAFPLTHFQPLNPPSFAVSHFENSNRETPSRIGIFPRAIHVSSVTFPLSSRPTMWRCAAFASAA